MAIGLPLETPPPPGNNYHTQDNRNDGLVPFVGGSLVLFSSALIFFNNYESAAPAVLNGFLGTVCILGSCCCLGPLFERLNIFQTDEEETPLDPERIGLISYNG